MEYSSTKLVAFKNVNDANVVGGMSQRLLPSEEQTNCQSCSHYVPHKSWKKNSGSPWPNLLEEGSLVTNEDVENLLALSFSGALSLLKDFKA
eukprot:CAMPEP_0172757702 /NCGR_PEP_ID=MMETSP1074-20121228/164322_1 /TAXON_ID=2916 /ORGANISM="Ceratium fusus, Strain PA161109" /LENGTH=91 /DNA_ID=CAMNT_0013591167 /DNA_START=59 /DNA_END=331 /DNA_ORIENTATION=+